MGTGLNEYRQTDESPAMRHVQSCPIDSLALGSASVGTDEIHIGQLEGAERRVGASCGREDGWTSGCVDSRGMLDAWMLKAVESLCVYLYQGTDTLPEEHVTSSRR